MIIQKGGMSSSEINEQPKVWLEAIKHYNKHKELMVWIKKMKFEQVIFVGSGASHHVGISASHVFKYVGKVYSIAFPSSEILFSEALPFDIMRRTLVIGVSRSGETDDTLWAIEHLKKIRKDIPVISIICKAGSSLQKISDRAIVIEEAMDSTMIPLRSFSTTLFFLELIAGAIGGDAKFLGELSKITKSLNIKDFVDKIRNMRVQTAHNIHYMGTGYNIGLASYGGLIMKEMSLAPGNIYQTLEFRHGQYVSSPSNSLYVMILSERLRAMELEAMRDAAKMKGLVLLIAEDLDQKAEAGVEFSVKLQSGLSPYARTFYIIPILQLIAFYYTIGKGFNPDKPKHLIDVVKFHHKPEFLGGTPPATPPPSAK